MIHTTQEWKIGDNVDLMRKMPADLPPPPIKWAEVLNEIYIFDTHLGTYGSGALVSYNKELLEKLNMNYDDMRKAVGFLEKHGFIIIENDNWHTITIKGVEFALKNERIKSDKNVQYTFLVFAATTVILGIINFIIR